MSVVLAVSGWLYQISAEQKPAQNGHGFRCRVTGVADGDTFYCLSGREKKTVRLYGIDAPEKTQAYGSDARQFLAGLVLRKTVSVTAYGQDRYGRTLGRVSNGGRDVNYAMVAAGYAWVYRQYDGDAGMENAQEAAKTAKSGLWADAAPVSPADYRKRH